MSNLSPPTFLPIKKFFPEDGNYCFWMEVKYENKTQKVKCKIDPIALEDKAAVDSIPNLEDAIPFIEKYWYEIIHRCRMKHLGNLHESDGSILIRTGEI